MGPPQIEIYAKCQPSNEQIAEIITKQGSRITNDFQIVEL